MTGADIAYAQSQELIDLGYRRTNIDDMVHRLVVHAPVPSDTVFRIDERALAAFGGPAEGYVYMFGGLHGRIVDNEDFQVAAQAHVQQEGVSREGGDLDGFGVQAVGMVSLLTHYGSAYVGPKYDQATAEGAVFADMNLDAIFVNFRLTRPVHQEVYGQLVQLGPRLDAWTVDWLSSSARALMGTISLNYQRIGESFDAGVLNAKSVFDIVDVEVAHDFRNGVFRNFVARLNIIPSRAPDDKGQSGFVQDRGVTKDFYGPVLSYFDPPEDEYPARFGGGIEISHALFSCPILAKGEMFIRRNFVDDIRQQGFLTDTWVGGATLAFGFCGKRRKYRDEAPEPEPGEDDPSAPDPSE